MIKNQQQAIYEGYFLRCRPYLESSWLVDLFTSERGLFGAITTATRRQGRGGTQRTKPQYFQLHQLRVKIKPGLARLSEHSQQKLRGFLHGRSLYAALYINELLLRLLPQHDPHPKLYWAYNKALVKLMEDEDFEPMLRWFEHILLQELGAGITWGVEARTRVPIDRRASYYFLADEGFILAVEQHSPARQIAIAGAHILAVAAHDYRNQATRQVAKTIMRAALAPLLGNRPLNSRMLFSSHNDISKELRT